MITAALDSAEVAAEVAYHGGLLPDYQTNPLAAEHRQAMRRALLAGAQALFKAEAERLRQGPHSALAMVIAAHYDGQVAELAIARG